MMRLWMETYSEPLKVGSSAALSAVAHVAVIAAAIAATAGAPQRLMKAIEERVQYLPPPDHVTPMPGPSETLHFMALPATGKMGFDRTPMNRHPSPAVTIPKQGAGDQPIAVPVNTGTSGADSVFSVLEVDSAVTRYADSASPSYPPDLLAKHIEGTVYTEYVVDTTGFADTASLVIIRSTHPGFAEAVREAMPYMRFRPAVFGSHKVRQLVEQQFTFRIQPPHPDSSTTPRHTGNG
jgi:protein TonB